MNAIKVTCVRIRKESRLNIVLIGFMCSGKSRVGKILADRLHWTHLDTDDMIRKDTGLAAGDIIRQKGEAAFRDAEAKAVELLLRADSAVVSTGGGVPLNQQNMENLAQNGKIVWLKVSPQTVLKRAGPIVSRPLIDQKAPLESIQQRLADREPIYSKYATYIVDSDSLDLDQMADKILSFFPSLKS